VLCLGAERHGLPDDLLRAAEATARIPLRADGPESLNVAMTAAIALYEAANRMAGHG
jgi:tRNA G18 (ribose-2'-O)-methylase SpoU